MWKLIMTSKMFAHVEKLIEFLDETNPVKVINKDQWLSFYDFSTTVKEDFSSYDDTSACKRYVIADWPIVADNHLGPVLFDEYAEWRRQ
jgi:hypothetical protein